MHTSVRNTVSIIQLAGWAERSEAQRMDSVGLRELSPTYRTLSLNA
jgi:hypothetical protein